MASARSISSCSIIGWERGADPSGRPNLPRQTGARITLRIFGHEPPPVKSSSRVETEKVAGGARPLILGWILTGGKRPTIAVAGDAAYCPRERSRRVFLSTMMKRTVKRGRKIAEPDRETRPCSIRPRRGDARCGARRARRRPRSDGMPPGDPHSCRRTLHAPREVALPKHRAANFLTRSVRSTDFAVLLGMPPLLHSRRRSVRYVCA